MSTPLRSTNTTLLDVDRARTEPIGERFERERGQRAAPGAAGDGAGEEVVHEADGSVRVDDAAGETVAGEEAATGDGDELEQVRLEGDVELEGVDVGHVRAATVTEQRSP